MNTSLTIFQAKVYLYFKSLKTEQNLVFFRKKNKLRKKLKCKKMKSFSANFLLIFVSIVF